MPKELVISAAPHETRVAILEDGLLCEIYIEREKEFALVGSIYKGRVTRVLPGMQSAFVDIGLDSDAFLYVGDFLENLEDYDHVVTTVEGKVEKMEQQGGAVFAQPAPAGAPAADFAAPSAAPSGDFAPTLSGPEVLESGGLPEVESPSAPPPSAPQRQPFARGPAPYAAQQQQGRAPGNFGPRQGRDRGDRGGNRRGGSGGGGRWRGNRGGDRRPQGRDLPPSKYASPRPFTPRPYEPPTEELPADFQPIILPGESLAKYKDRVPAANPPAPAETSSGETSNEVRSDEAPYDTPPVSTASLTPPAAFAPGLPSSLYATPTEIREEKESEPPTRWTSATPLAAPPIESPAPFETAAVDEEEDVTEEVPLAEPEHAHLEASDSAVKHADLSEEEASSLAERLAEARHEEASAEAEATSEHSALDEEDPHAPESGAETEEFIAEAEAGESEDAAIIEATGEGMEEAVAEGGPAEQPESLQPQAHPMSARISEPNRARFQRPMRRGGRPQGNRPPRRQDHRHQAQKRPQLISEVLKSGQEIIVQIAKEPLGKKGARITSHVALPGRFLVYMPTVNHIGVSRRISSAEERSRLRRLVTESKGTFPGGFIVRTAADGAPEDEVRADVEFLGRTWEKIRTQSEPRKSPALLHRDLNLVERILRDYVSNDYTSIWIDNEEEFGKVVEFVSRFQPKLVSRVKLYTKPTPIFEEFGIQQELDKALRPKVWLKSGGYIVINHTEALVAIDVNTGKYVGRGGTRLEDTIVKTNLEAVKEIVRQVRLRDLGGIIILDFIDMEERRNREKVMAALDSALRADRAPSKALSFNEFGLVAITRKRTKQALERVLCQPCPYCTGSGMVKSVPTICYEIQAEARKMAADLDATSITLRVHPEIAKALKTREAMLIEELEQATRKSAIIQADPTLHWEQYDIY